MPASRYLRPSPFALSNKAAPNHPPLRFLLDEKPLLPKWLNLKHHYKMIFFKATFPNTQSVPIRYISIWKVLFSTNYQKIYWKTLFSRKAWSTILGMLPADVLAITTWRSSWDIAQLSGTWVVTSVPAASCGHFSSGAGRHLNSQAFHVSWRSKTRIT